VKAQRALAWIEADDDHLPEDGQDVVVQTFEGDEYVLDYDGSDLDKGFMVEWEHVMRWRPAIDEDYEGW